MKTTLACVTEDATVYPVFCVFTYTIITVISLNPDKFGAEWF